MSESFWVEGTLSTIRLSGSTTQGRLAMLEETLPAGPGPPLHAHPEDETYHVLEGELLLWNLSPLDVPEPLSAWPPALVSAAERRGPGSTSFVPGGAPHTYCVISATARILVISTPAGLEEWTRAFGVRVSDSGPGPRGAPPAISPERRRQFAQARGVRRLGPPPPPPALLPFSDAKRAS